MAHGGIQGRLTGVDNHYESDHLHLRPALGRTDSMIYIGALSLTIKVFAITNAILAMFYCAWVTNRFIKEKKRNRKSKVTTIVKIVHVPVDSGSLEASDSNNPSEAAAAAR